ncbi:MAG: AAA family ATPase [Burkholderiaceae bacterium]
MENPSSPGLKHAGHAARSDLPGPDLLRQVIAGAGEGLVEREEAVRLLVLAALSGEHLLLIGPPGTAKSELAKRLHRLFGGRYFERLLTRFSVPEELFGPLSLAALDDGRYERDIDGYLPRASIAFLDEVFKANSAILNALLTLLNEREFDQGPARIEVPLICLVAASNEVPDDETLRAFEDRFLLRARVSAVSDERFGDLLATVPAAGPVPARLTETHVHALHQAAQQVAFPDEMAALLGALRVRLRETGIEISDRRWVRAVQMLRLSAVTCGRNAVATDDLWLIKALVGETPEYVAIIEDWYCDLLGAESAVQPTWAIRVVEAFEQQYGQEESATELAFDDSGKLAIMKGKSGADDEMLQSAAPRMSAFSKRKLYSASHIGARIKQIDEVLGRFAGYLASGEQYRSALTQRLQSNVFLPPALAARIQQNLETSLARMAAVEQALQVVRTQYDELPLAEVDDGVVPPPVDIVNE